MSFSICWFRKSLAVLGFFTLFSPLASHTAEVALHKEPLTQLISTSPWQFEFGPRYWYSSARYQETLFDISNTLASRLTYEDLSANSAEGFWKLAHQNGIYLKGYLGGGAIGGGQLADEDFPPGITPYSRTISPQKNGSLSYLSADLGYNLFNAATWRLGGYIGYHYWQEQVNNFGCRQVATGPVCVSPLATSIDVLNNSATWDSLRLGINGELYLGDSWHLETDLAYIHSALQENDFHNLRADIRGVLDTGTGNGFQLDVILKWLLTERLSLGAGGRWWYLATNGWAHFEQLADPAQAQPLDGIQSRYGLLLEASYQFLDRPNLSKESSLTEDFDWKGSYLGINMGYATNPSMVYIDATSAITQALQAEDFSTSSLNIQNAGFLAGGQLGYNWQVKQVLLGIEADLDYAQIGGANAVTSSAPLTTTLSSNLRWLSTVRGRIGKLPSRNMLVYLTTGPAWGGTTLAFDQRDLTTSCASSSPCLTTEKNKTQTGWAAGGGIEYAATSRMTFKAEYLYVDLGSFRLNSSTQSTLGPISYLMSTSYKENTLRLGINYKMNFF